MKTAVDICRMLCLVFSGVCLDRDNFFLFLLLIAGSVMFHICQDYIPDEDEQDAVESKK